MPIDYEAIAAEVSDAIAEVGFTAILRKETGGPATPWDAGAPTVADTEITVIDDGIRDRYIPGTLTTRRSRVLTVAVANGSIPAKPDQIQVRGVWFEIEEVMPLAPGGVDLLYEVELVT
jgi:hypothetical protein